MNQRLFSNNRLTVILHVLAWSIILILPRYIIKVYGDGNVHYLNQYYTETFLYGILFYLNYFFLVPRFFLNKSKLWYFLLSMGSVLTVIFIMNLLNEKVFFDPVRAKQFERVMKEINKGKEMVRPPFKLFRIYGYFYTSVLIWGFSFGLAVLKQLSQNEKARKELEKEKLNSELALLKNQVSPHFFFNTLNNIYSLIGLDADKAQESVHKLSKLMRYLLYESDAATSNLGDEISFMTHYIDLMKLRLTEKVKLEVVFPENVSDINVPPLLFVPFIENAFKHGISYRENSYITIRMELSEQKIHFSVVNSKVTMPAEKDGIHSGIGLANVQKRLNLLYPGSHNLVINDTELEFKAELTLNV